MFYPCSITINKCKGICNTINDPCAELCVPEIIKNIKVKVLNLMSRTNETRHIEWHETCKCKYRLDASVCNSKCKELTHKGMCDKGFILNPSNCECKCSIGEYLDYKSCKCKNNIIDKLIEECNENIDGNKMLYNETLNAILLITILLNTKACNSPTIYKVLFAIFFITSIRISSAFIYFYWHLKKDNVRVKFNSNTQTTIY